MDARTILIICGMALVTYLIRVIPQIALSGRRVPPGVDRYLRYLAHALIAAVIAVSLFVAGGRIDVAAAPPRAAGLAVAVVVAAWSGRALLGMIAGTAVVLALAR